jgi:hypothetical protein
VAPPPPRSPRQDRPHHPAVLAEEGDQPHRQLAEELRRRQLLFGSGRAAAHSRCCRTAEPAHRQKPGLAAWRVRAGVFDSLLVYTVQRPVIGTITLSATLGALFFGVTFVKMSDTSDHLTLAVVLGVVGVALGLVTGIRIAKRGLPNLDRQIRTNTKLLLTLPLRLYGDAAPRCRMTTPSTGRSTPWAPS